MHYISKSPKQTEKIGLKLAKKLKGGDIIGLIGELGSGKTCFVKGLAKGLGIKKKISSPSFIFLRVLPVCRNKKIKFLVHLDLYRLKNIREIENIIPLDFFNKKYIIMVIEWAERIKNVLPRRARYIKFKVLKNSQRKIIV